MKYLLMLLIFFGCDYASVHAQDTIPQNIKKFWDSLDQYKPSLSTKKRGFVREFSHKELKSIAREYVKAMDEDPVAFDKYLEMKHRETTKNRKNNPNDYKVGFVLGTFMEEIMRNKNFPQNFTAIIQTPCFIKATVLKRYDSTLKDEDIGFSAGHKSFIVKVEDVVRGKKYIKPGDEIKIFSFNLRGYPAGPFEEGKTYFFAMLRNDDKDPEHIYHIVTLPDNCTGVYPVENNMFTASKRAFQLGEPNKWEKFKERFISTYIEF